MINFRLSRSMEVSNENNKARAMELEKQMTQVAKLQNHLGDKDAETQALKNEMKRVTVSF